VARYALTVSHVALDSSRRSGLDAADMERTDVNPWEWSTRFGFSQAVEMTGAERTLYCSGQTAISADGSPPTTTDMREQANAAMANLQTVLQSASMTLANVVRLTIYTTDMDALVGAFRAVTAPLAPNLPAITLIGVSRLAYPQLQVEIEATAVA
jgi:enamine deaminase RidA (YjgF/YER057c/UK114 family)